MTHTTSGDFRSRKMANFGALNKELALLGGLNPTVNQTRVLAANLESSLVRPADLDAFLRVRTNAL